MIRINLLPTKAVVRATTFRTQVIIASVVVLVSLIGMFSWAASLNSRISKLDSDIAQKQKELKEVEKARKKLKAIKKLNNNLKKKLEVIDNIEKARTGPVWMMDQLTDAISRFPVKSYKTGEVTWRYLDDKVFLKKMNIAKGKITLEGIAINNTYLVAFLNNLKSKSDVFVNVKLLYSDTTKYRKALVRKFKVTCKVKLKAKPRIGGPSTIMLEESSAGEESEDEETTRTKTKKVSRR